MHIGGSMQQNLINNNEKYSIDVQTGALILIDMLYSQKLINKETYNNIQSKYNSQNTNTKNK